LVYTNLTRIFALAIIIIGIVVIIGWLADIDTLKRLVPTWVTMKFSTALSFLMTGIIVGLLNESRNRNNEFAKIFLFAPIMIILFFMATLLVSTIAETSSGVSSLFIKEDPAAALGSVKAGTPSVGTMINFLLIIGVGFTYLIARKEYTKYLTICGAIIIALGIIALIGYAIENPSLYYQIEGFSGAMALHTAIAFILSGIGLILLGKPKIVETSISRKKFTIKISQKLVLFFLIAALIPIIVLGSISLDLAKTSLEKENFATINENADLQVDRIESFFFERKANTEVMSKGIIFYNEIPILNKFYKDTTSEEYIASDERLDHRLKAVRNAYGYDNIMVANPDGEIIFVSKNESKPTYLGKSMLEIDEKTIIEGKKAVYVSEIIPDIGGDGRPELYTAAPINDPEGNLLGILIFDIQVLRFLDALMQESYNGDSGESLIAKRIGSEIVFLHNLRFDTDAALNRKIPLEGEVVAMHHAVSGENGFDIAKDDRNVEVLAAWRHIPELDWGLVSKIDTAEAFSPIDQLQQDITVLAIVFMIGVGFFAVSAARSLSKPIIAIKNLAEDISKGKLDARTIVHSSDEIGQLESMMNKTAEKLQESDKQKTEFAAMITHELKTPLVPIQGYAEMLKNPKLGSLNDDQKDAVNEILANSKQLLSLIQNVLNAQKLEAQGMKYNKKSHNVDEFIKNVMKTMEHYTTPKNIKFTESVEKGLTMYADSDRMMEIFNNIVANAVDFTPENTGIIHIDGKSDGKFVQFSVKDNGVGIPKEKHSGMFKKNSSKQIRLIPENMVEVD